MAARSCLTPGCPNDVEPGELDCEPHRKSSAASVLDQRRALGLCSLCGGRLADKERALEGVGGSYIRCDDCVNELMHDPYFPYMDGDDA